jgi:hypothetical protein
MVKHNARRTRHRADSAATAREASSREAYSLWHARSVAAAGAALRPAAMQTADHIGVFLVRCLPHRHQAFPNGSYDGKSTVCEFGNFTEMGVLQYLLAPSPSTSTI